MCQEFYYNFVQFKQYNLLYKLHECLDRWLKRTCGRDYFLQSVKMTSIHHGITQRITNADNATQAWKKGFRWHAKCIIIKSATWRLETSLKAGIVISD